MRGQQGRVLQRNRRGQGSMVDKAGKLEWDDAFRTGITVLDDQHLAIVLLFNDVLRAVDSRASQRMVAETVDSLIFFVRQHFEWEERFMASVGYDRAAEHRAAHGRFDSVARAFHSYLGTADDGACFAAFARGWILEHISNDRDVSTFMTTRHPGAGLGVRVPVAAGGGD